MEFQPFPKVPRLNRETIITEKIDGTNGCIVIDFDGDDCEVYAQSRNRIVTPGKSTDNYGFGAWVADRSDELVSSLGPGRHFGEFWGQGIGRGYDLAERRFSLFNSTRWIPSRTPADTATDWALDWELGLYVVPTLAIYGRFPPQGGDLELRRLRQWGSHAKPGFQRPEGIILYHSVSNSMFKATIENDEMPKAEAERAQRLAGEKAKVLDPGYATGGVVQAQLYLAGEGAPLDTVPGYTSLVA